VLGRNAESKRRESGKCRAITLTRSKDVRNTRHGAPDTGHMPRHNSLDLPHSLLSAHLAVPPPLSPCPGSSASGVQPPWLAESSATNVLTKLAFLTARPPSAPGSTAAAAAATTAASAAESSASCQRGRAYIYVYVYMYMYIYICVIYSHNRRVGRREKRLLW